MLVLNGGLITDAGADADDVTLGDLMQLIINHKYKNNGTPHDEHQGPPLIISFIKP
jgi:hypothetical protein